MPLRSNKDISALMEEGTQVDAALRRAAREALAAHVRAGLPVVEWRDGKCVWVPPDEIQKQIEKMDSDAKP